MVLLVPYKGEGVASLQELGTNGGSGSKGEVHMRRKTGLPVQPYFPSAGLPSGAVINSGPGGFVPLFKSRKIISS